MLLVVVKSMLGHLVAALMLSIGLTARPSMLADIGRRWWFYLRAVLVFELAVPILAMVVPWILRIPTMATALIVIVAICPGAPFLPRATKRESEHFSATGLDLLVIVSVLVPITIPLWLGLLDRLYPFDLSIPPILVLERTLENIVVPLVLGFALQLLVPSIAARLARIASTCFLVALVIAIAIAAYLGAPVFLEVAPITLLAVVIVTVGAMMIGYWAAEPDHEDRRVVAIAAALGNPGLALAIVTTSFPDVRATAFVAAYILFRTAVMLPIAHVMKRGDAVAHMH